MWHFGWRVVAVVLFNDNVVFFFSFLFLSNLFLRARRVLFVSVFVTDCYALFPLLLFSSSFPIVWRKILISLNVPVEKMRVFFGRYRKAYLEKDIKSIGASNIFPYLCLII